MGLDSSSSHRRRRLHWSDERCCCEVQPTKEEGNEEGQEIKGIVGLAWRRGLINLPPKPVDIVAKAESRKDYRSRATKETVGRELGVTNGGITTFAVYTGMRQGEILQGSRLTHTYLPNSTRY